MEMSLQAQVRCFYLVARSYNRETAPVVAIRALRFFYSTRHTRFIEAEVVEDGVSAAIKRLKYAATENKRSMESNEEEKVDIKIRMVVSHDRMILWIDKRDKERRL